MGVVHGELTTLLWGGAFGFVWVYASVTRIIVGRSARLRDLSGSLEVVSEVLVFRIRQRPPCPAFFRWEVVAWGSHGSDRSFLQTRPLSGPEITFDRVPRGLYEAEVRFEMTDAFGLTRLIPRVRWQTTLVVEPTALPFSRPPPEPTQEGRLRPRTGRRAGDPFDVRPYHPGDDLRRLHWPLYAHAGTLFVRTADPSPPPSGHQFIVLDTEAASNNELDERLGCLLTWLNELNAEGVRWTLVLPSVGTVTSPHLPSLAGLQPQPWGESIDPSWPPTVTVLTGKGPGWPSFVKRLTAAHRSIRPLVISPKAEAPQARPWWRRL